MAGLHGEILASLDGKRLARRTGLLQSHPDSRDRWGTSEGDNGAAINIVLNVPAPQPVDESKVLIIGD